MTRVRRFLLACLAAAISLSGLPVTAGEQARYKATDTLFAAIQDNAAAAGLEPVLTIDHARLAADTGVTMPPARVALFADWKATAAIMADNPRAGLDLPFRALAYQGADGPAVAYTAASFLKARHGLSSDGALAAMDRALTAATSGLSGGTATPVTGEGVNRDFGILSIPSRFGFAETVERLKAVVRAQADTVWFGEIDFTARAAAEGANIPPAALLLFGGPKPGGVAMAQFPVLGLDAFCQKLLVLETGGKTEVLLNSIADLARLHYGKTAPPHLALDERLTATFRQAVAAAQ